MKWLYIFLFFFAVFVLLSLKNRERYIYLNQSFALSENIEFNDLCYVYKNTDKKKELLFEGNVEEVASSKNIFYFYIKMWWEDKAGGWYKIDLDTNEVQKIENLNFSVDEFHQKYQLNTMKINEYFKNNSDKIKFPFF